MNPDELLQQLTAERYDNRWWITPAPALDDSEIATARRRKALLDAWTEREKEVG